MLLTLIVIVLLITAGCTTLLEPDEPAAVSAGDDMQPPASYKITISQPDADAALIRMDTDVYNEGEVVEFVITNTGLLPLECTNTPPDFRVIFQAGSGRWATKMGPDVPVRGNSSYLQHGESTQVYRFVTQGWEEGRYRIVSDCGPKREFLIRTIRTPVPEPVAAGGPANETANTTAAVTIPAKISAATCPENPDTGTGPWIKIDPIPDQVAGRPFTISGTTNLPAGTDLYYVIFSVYESPQKPALSKEAAFSTLVGAGRCGTNTWSTTGEIQATGQFFIGIENRDGTATAIRRFSVDL